MKKKMILIIFLLLALIIFSPGADASGQDAVQVKVNGQLMLFDVNPVIDSGRTLVPVRGIFERMGAEVKWDAVTRTVAATRGELKIKLQIDNTGADVNGKPVVLDVPAKIVDGRTLVPVRFISESIGAKVDWNAQSRTVLIDDTAIDPFDYHKLYQAVNSSDQAKFTFNLKEELTVTGKVISANFLGSGVINKGDVQMKGSVSIPELNDYIPMEITLKEGELYSKIGDNPWQVAQIDINKGLIPEDEFVKIIKNIPLKQEVWVDTGGKAAIRYTISTDREELTGFVNKLFAQSVQFDSLGSSTAISGLKYNIVFYLDEQGRLVKEHIELSMNAAVPELQATTKIKAAGDIEFSDIGKEFTTTVPIM